MLAGLTTAGFTSLALQNATPLYVGKSGVNPTSLNGKIDKVKIYDHALSDSEVLHKYNYYFKSNSNHEPERSMTRETKITHHFPIQRVDKASRATTDGKSGKVLLGYPK